MGAVHVSRSGKVHRRGPGRLALTGRRPLAVPLTLVNANAVPATAPVVTIGHAFAAGDVPAGCRVKLLSSTGQAVALQQDQEVYRPDGSLQFAVLALQARPDEIFAANGGADRHAYLVRSEPYAPNRTPAFTLAQFVAANDLKVLFSGLDCGAETYSVAMNDVVANFKAAPWDAGPLALTAAAASGASTVTVADTSHVSVGMLVSGTGAAALTLVSAVSGGTVTLSKPLTAAVASGATLTFNSALGGWQVIRTGPLCTEWKVWSYLRAVGGANAGKYHTQIRVTLYIRSWGLQGPHEIEGDAECPNAYGNMPGGSIGPSSTPGKRLACVATVQNGSRVLHSFGGPADTRVFTLQPSAFNTTDGTVTLPDQTTTYLKTNYGNGFGCMLASTGSLPGTLQSGKPYWLASGRVMADRRCVQGVGQGNWAASTAYNSGDIVASGNAVYQAQAAGTSGATAPTGDVPPVDGSVTWGLISGGRITTQGTGIISVQPTFTIWPFSGSALASDTAEPIWDAGSSGIASRPYLMPVYEPTYLTTQTKICPPFDLTATSYPRASGTLVDRGVTGIYEGYAPGQPQPWYWKISNYGDDPGDERVGDYPTSSALLMVQQDDRHNDLVVRSLALGFSDYNCYVKNERSGLAITLNAGPSKTPAGPQYPGLGPNDTTTAANGAGLLPMFPGQSTADWSGHEITYGPLIDSTHMPMMAVAAYLRTGRRIFLEQMISLSNTLNLTFTPPQRNPTIAGKTYYGSMLTESRDSARGAAWCFKIFAQTNRFLPSADLLKPYYEDVMDDTAAYLADYYPSQVPQSLRALGMTRISADTGQALYNAYQNNFLALVLGMEAWRDLDDKRRPQWLAFIKDYHARWLINVYDTDAGGGFYYGPNGGPQCYSGNVQMSATNSLANAAQTPADLWAIPQNGGLSVPQPTPFAPSVGIYKPTTYPFDTVCYHTCWAAAMAVWSWAGVPKARTMWQRWHDAANAAPYTGVVWAQNGTNGHYDLYTPQSYLPWCLAPKG